ncbi:universal stress protein [Flavihumibacter sp. CACIAM 22H1]|uniref:universal stress protein n=1 Tax=Flavihumibacter sp. CACIAM 22H1 TaxID=1812911 RepID=UPI0007A8952E|nr:universal stress protein [Flavihumibacter sp. CACIAM 22H1]KYP13292.1 MAG: hypothetical protein A1D16_06550 [Flavihumibacter sp. CACIAM 22H1]
MLKRILVPTDFSPTSERAFRYALEVASRTGGTVVLYHVYEQVEAGFIDNETKRTAYNQQMETDLLKELNRMNVKYQAAFPKVIVSTVLGHAPVVDNVLGFAEEHRMDTIVMGTQGATGLKKTLLGTIASRIAEKSDWPVWLIPEAYEWKLPQHLVLATDYQLADKKALPLLTAIASVFGADITVTRIISGHITREETAKEQARFSEYSNLLQKDFAASSLSFQLITSSSIIDTLEHLEEEIPYDLLTMVRLKKTFLQRFFTESFTRNMAYLTRHPFLVMADDA